MAEVDETPLEIERRGAVAGVNPMFGEWRQRYNFPPVPYRDGGTKLKEFRKQVHAATNTRFLFSNEVHLTITLYLDVQSVLETDETADVDNYAKALLDALKGSEGILLDDTQVQALWISWLDSPTTFFEVKAKASPDDFILKPVKFYEMPDGLWYPHSSLLWANGGAAEAGDLNYRLGLLINEAFSRVQKSARHEFRQASMDKLRAYQNGRYMTNSHRGFHKSRVQDGGFELIALRDWKAECEAWISRDPEATEIAILLAKELDGMFEAMKGALGQ
jgi:Holliday junction resolvase RusA-like endonuclease